MKPRAPGDFALFVNATVGPIQGTGLVNEPSVANRGRTVFYTGNWYAARSADGGATWAYVDPEVDMPDFCCDQDVIYDPGWDIFLWYRQGLQDAAGGNRFRLGVSRDAEAWLFYDVRPEEVDPALAGKWFDYPSLAYGNAFLYIATNVFLGDTFDRSLLLRWPLASLRLGDPAFFDYYWALDVFTFSPVQGATTRMYWASHVDTATVRVYASDEAGTDVTTRDIPIPPFASTPDGSARCPAPDGGDICARTDDRILGGWVANGTIGFLWNVRQDSLSGFPHPYIYVVRIVESTRTFLDAPIIWNSDFAWIYGWASPNGRGHLGLVAMVAGPTRFPTFVVGLSDDFTVTPSAREWYVAAAGTNGPDVACLGDPAFPCGGDYLRVRASGGAGDVWVASGYTFEGDPLSPVPRYVMFGRARDDPFDFSLSTSGDIDVPRGASGSTTVAVALLDGEPRPIALRCAAGLPPGASCSFSPDSGQPTFMATLTIATTASTSVGSFLVSVLGETAGKTNETQLTLNVVVPPPLLLAISADPLTGVTPLPVSFQSTVTSGVSPYTFAWTFGDGVTSDLPNPSHTYAEQGEYNVTLTVEDAAGQRVTERLQIVARAPASPGATLGWLPYVVIAAIVAAVVVALALVLRRRRAPAAPPPGIPSVPPPPPPAEPRVAIGMPQVPSIPVPPPPPQEERMECPSCGLLIPAREGPCPVCGAPVTPPIPVDPRMRALEEAYRAGRISEALYRSNLERLRKK